MWEQKNLCGTFSFASESLEWKGPCNTHQSTKTHWGVHSRGWAVVFCIGLIVYWTNLYYILWLCCVAIEPPPDPVTSVSCPSIHWSPWSCMRKNFDHLDHHDLACANFLITLITMTIFEEIFLFLYLLDQFWSPWSFIHEFLIILITITIFAKWITIATFLDALASLDFKLSLTESVTFFRFSVWT